MILTFLTFLPMTVCLFWSIAITTRLYETRRRHFAALSSFMLVGTLLYWGHCMFFNHQTDIIPVSDSIYSFCNLAVYPLYLSYITSMTTNDSKWRSHTLLWLLPSLICGMLTSCLYAMMTPDETQMFIESYLYQSKFETLTGTPLLMSYIHILCRIVFAVQIPLVVILGSRQTRNFDRLVESMYADTEHKSLYHLHFIFYFFVASSLMSALFNIIGKHYFISSAMALAFPAITFSCLLYALGYIGCRHNFTYADIELDECLAPEDSEQKTEESTAISAQPSELRLRIEQIMTEEKLFLRNNLKLADLVQALGSNRNYVYNAINKEMGVSFTEYVNRLRIDYACEMLKQHPNITILNLSRKSGFTSPVSFYRNFKLYKGCVPKDYEHK